MGCLGALVARWLPACAHSLQCCQPASLPARPLQRAECERHRCPTCRRLTWEEQLQYKYTLDIDGHGGTWRLKHLFLSGSLVFKVDSPINQFWMVHLEPWVRCRAAVGCLQCYRNKALGTAPCALLRWQNRACSACRSTTSRCRGTTLSRTCS